MDRLEGELKEVLSARTAETSARGGHPTPELLAAYHAGEVPEDQRRRLEEHLVWCRECTALLLGLEGLLELDGELPADDPQIDQAWRSLRESLQPAPPPQLEAPRPFPARRWISPRLLSAIAASLLVGVLGLSAWVVHLNRTVAALSEPQVNAVVLDLYGADTQRDSEPEPFGRIPAGSGTVTLILNSVQTGEHLEYSLLIETLDGTEVWRRAGLRRSRWNTFTVTLPGGFLPPGRYRLRLSGVEKDGREVVEEFPLEILAR